MRWLKRLYDWVLSWADTPYGSPALAVLAFAESSFFPVPPDVLLIALCLGDRTKWLRFALVCSLASLAGGLAGYALGWGFWTAIDDVFFRFVPGFAPEEFAYVQSLYERWNFWVVFAAAFTPIPYKVITVTAGVFGINLVLFIIASAAGRSARFFLVAYLLYVFGAPVKDFIERRFNLLTVVFTVLLVGGFLIIRFLLR